MSSKLTKFSLNTLADLKEQEIKHIDSDLSPPEKVQQAIDCLPLSSEKQPFFHRWTVLDYSKAYSSGDITPRMVSFCICDHLLLACFPVLA